MGTMSNGSMGLLDTLENTIMDAQGNTSMSTIGNTSMGSTSTGSIGSIGHNASMASLRGLGNLSLYRNLTMEQLNMLANGLKDDPEVWIDSWAGFILEGVALPIVATFGIFGNILCFFVFTKKKKMNLKPSFINILRCLSVFDTIFLACEVWIYGLSWLMPDYYWQHWIDPILFPYVLPVTQIALTGSVYTVVAVALERYFNICKPFSRNLGSVWDGLGYIITIITFSLLYNIIKFFEFTTGYTECVSNLPLRECEGLWGKEFNATLRVATVQYTDLRSDPVYSTVLLVTNTAVVGVIPIVMLFYLNSRIIQTMDRYTKRHNTLCSVERRRDQTMSALLTGVVMVLVICHSPKAAMNIYECYQLLSNEEEEEVPLWVRLIIKISHLLLAVSSASNIIIYSYKDFNFRQVLVRHCPVLRLSSCALEEEQAAGAAAQAAN